MLAKTRASNNWWESKLTIIWDPPHSDYLCPKIFNSWAPAMNQKEGVSSMMDEVTCTIKSKPFLYHCTMLVMNAFLASWQNRNTTVSHNSYVNVEYSKDTEYLLLMFCHYVHKCMFFQRGRVVLWISGIICTQPIFTKTHKLNNLKNAPDCTQAKAKDKHQW